jgi:predicted enzyme related to lactoylglutathione lyase
MPDPFESLRAPVVPVDPDPAFADRLRERVERALALPRGVPVTTIDLDHNLNQDLDHDPVTIVPPTPSAAIPYLAVRDGRAAIDWYVDVLGARLRGEPIMMPDGRVGHAELEFAGAGVMYLAEEFPEIGHVAPSPGAASVSLVLAVADVDRTAAAAVLAGAEMTSEVSEGYGHRGATIVDPFGHRWMLQTPLPDAPAADTAGDGDIEVEYRHGDIAYTSLWVPDAARAATFFSAVLGWTFAGEPDAGHARQVLGATPAQGIFGGHERSTLFACFAVDDVDSAVARIRDAGGETGEPTAEPYGRVADCTDDQGTPFAVVQLPEASTLGTGAPGTGTRVLNGRREGDLTYMTFEVRDSARARAFYQRVLGWEFAPGRVDDGWGVLEVAPMTGMHGGHDVATGVPMYRVDDIEAAVARVRSAGGTATDPERQPYGISADCVDDQGTRFYLGEL